MSSFKKATKLNQKTHRERHQPKSREKLGLLEKKKDYQLRTQDRHEKEDTIKLLRKKALNKNPDEFYHHMINSKIENDEHFEKDKDEELTPEQMKLMETQDKKYIIMKRTIERRKIQRLQNQLHLVDDPARKLANKHTIFAENEEDAKKIDLDLATRVEMSTKSKLDDATTKRLNGERNNSYKELEKRKGREKELAQILRKIELKNVKKIKNRGLKNIISMEKSPHEVFKIAYQRKK